MYALRNSVALHAALSWVVVTGTLTPLAADEHVLHSFDRVELTDVYFSEGANAGDIDGDGQVDIVYGPWWFAGPDYKKRRQIYAAKPQNRESYANSFFSWVHDVDGDGRNDVFSVGFPGTPAHVYVNPGPQGLHKIWRKHQVFDWVSNESPHFVDLVGDESPELVCTRDGHFGYATIDPESPLEAWIFHAVSDKITATRFGHGLGVGDINGDGRTDLLHAGGWFEQPQDAGTAKRWRLHPVRFTDSYGGAEMHAYDVDGDGDNDVITSLAAHDFGLAWYEQQAKDGKITFERHLIMGDRPGRNRYGLVFSELHSVALHDIDGVGLKDIVTGKTFYSHHKKSPLWNAGAVVYWFELVRSKQGVDWVPHRVDGDAGIGRQISIHDLNGDRLPDIVVGGMKGSNVLLHRVESVDEERWRAARPKPVPVTGERADRGRPASFDEKTGRVEGAIEAETMKVVRVGGGKVRKQNMAGFKTGRWSGSEQLFWTGARPRARLVLELEVAEANTYAVAAAFTTARDYAIVNLLLDDEALRRPVDLYDYPDVGTTGELDCGTRKLGAGKHRLTVEITGANDSAVQAYRVGFDYLRLVRAQ